MPEGAFAGPAWVRRIPGLGSSSAGQRQMATSSAVSTEVTAAPIAKYDEAGTSNCEEDTRESASWMRRVAGMSAHLTASISSAAASAVVGSRRGQEVAVSGEVARALREGGAVVALESTIITHGMPWPQNLATAEAVEAIVREQGAVPATVAVLSGVPTVGLSKDQLRHLAHRGPEVRKTSRRDLPYVVARHLDGATTVAATMLLAAHAGISVFVTGGIGGVHRGGENTMDVSADLTELARTPVAVVCGGVKTILDIPRTLEYLETQGVCVAAYGSDEFPAFFTRHSSCVAPCRIDSPADAARLVRAALALRLGGLVVGVPIPEQHAAAGAAVERAIGTALREATSKGIAGAATTPFLLRRVQELTGGASLAANVALIKHNAAIGSQIAMQLARRY